MCESSQYKSNASRSSSYCHSHGLVLTLSHEMLKLLYVACRYRRFQLVRLLQLLQDSALSATLVSLVCLIYYPNSELPQPVFSASSAAAGEKE